jgi:hypothetical protein
MCGQARVAVHLAVAHVEFVGEFVDDHVDAVEGVLALEPRQQHRAALPGFAEHLVFVFMDDTVFVGEMPRNDEVPGTMMPTQSA